MGSCDPGTALQGLIQEAQGPKCCADEKRAYGKGFEASTKVSSDAKLSLLFIYFFNEV